MSTNENMAEKSGLGVVKPTAKMVQDAIAAANSMAYDSPNKPGKNGTISQANNETGAVPVQTQPAAHADESGLAPHEQQIKQAEPFFCRTNPEDLAEEIRKMGFTIKTDEKGIIVHANEVFIARPTISREGLVWTIAPSKTRCPNDWAEGTRRAKQG